MDAAQSNTWWWLSLVFSVSWSYFVYRAVQGRGVKIVSSLPCLNDRLAVMNRQRSTQKINLELFQKWNSLLWIIFNFFKSLVQNNMKLDHYCFREKPRNGYCYFNCWGQASCLHIYLWLFCLFLFCINLSYWLTGYKNSSQNFSA